MNGAYEVGAVALRAQQRALETHANNVANINTPGFKRAEVEFSEIVSTQTNPLTENERLARQSAVQNGGVRMATRMALSDHGELQPTGSSFDIAIDGSGFIELMGPDGESLLWRGGKLEVDRDGLLAAQSLSPLRAMIAVPDDTRALSIANDGTVQAEIEGGELLELGQIMLVRQQADSDLIPLGSGQYRLAEGAFTTDAVPGEDGIGFIRQGMMEQSNVEMTEAMVEMLILQRAYAASAQVIQTADQVASITNSLSR
ncbi:flagellar hook-basal body protein [uncultured Erythrobacter sp.]|uniref:flagellar hook-basal body protein n=1 Tax=uncultured Erythrobacter sp. TaxID=263913 RepID=UPI002611C9FA|nr:flagellar hook basal-body protein [uncultured Erythrobacter sp.]